MRVRNHHTKSDPHPTTKQHAEVSIQLYINMSYVSREINTRQFYCTVFTTTFRYCQEL